MKKYLFYSLLAIIVCGTAGLSIVSAYGFWDKNQEKIEEKIDWMVENGKFTQEEADEKLEAIEEHRSEMIETKASLLGLTSEELLVKLESGMTFKEIAEEAGVDLQELRNQMREQMKEKFGDEGFKAFGRGPHKGFHKGFGGGPFICGCDND